MGNTPVFVQPTHGKEMILLTLSLLHLGFVIYVIHRTEMDRENGDETMG